MGKSEKDFTTLQSGDSGYGDTGDAASVDTAALELQSHPLSQKGYAVALASNLNIGDVFEFLWADADDYLWEWKCLGYTRFIVLRHSETFPHHAVCIPVCVGSKHEFAKPGIDSFQQGYVFGHGDADPGIGQKNGGPKLPYSAVAIELRPGKLRVKEDSRANYADLVEVHPDAQVMVVGDVARYFDRVRRNVNRAVMRQILRTALEEYKSGKTRRPDGKSIDGLGANQSARASTIQLSMIDGEEGGDRDDEENSGDTGYPHYNWTHGHHRDPDTIDEAVEEEEGDEDGEYVGSVIEDDDDATPRGKRGFRERLKSSTRPPSLRKLSRSSHHSHSGRGPSRRQSHESVDYDGGKSMQNVAMAGFK